MQLSSKADLSIAFINSIENGQKWVSSSTLEKLCEVLDAKPYEFFLTETDPTDELEIIAVNHERLLLDINDIVHRYTKNLNKEKEEI